MRSLVKSNDTVPEAVKIPTLSPGGRLFATSRSAASADIRTPNIEACASSKNSAIDRGSGGGAWSVAAADGFTPGAGAGPAGCALSSEKNVISRGCLSSRISKSAAGKPPVRCPWRSRTVAANSTKLASVEITRSGGYQEALRMRTSGVTCARAQAQQIETSSSFEIRSQTPAIAPSPLGTQHTPSAAMRS